MKRVARSPEGSRYWNPIGIKRINSSAHDKRNRKNLEIRVPRVRVIGLDGEMVGVLTRDEAIALAEESGVDLVEIQPTAEPPVCRIMDFGKYMFDLQKKANAAKKKQKMKASANASSALISRERSSTRCSINGALVASMSSWLTCRPRPVWLAAARRRRNPHR